MSIEAEQSLRFWKRIARLGLVSTGVLLAAILMAILFLRSPARQIDERLLDTWQSDADSTIAACIPILVDPS